MNVLDFERVSASRAHFVSAVANFKGKSTPFLGGGGGERGGDSELFVIVCYFRRLNHFKWGGVDFHIGRSTLPGDYVWMRTKGGQKKNRGDV